MSVYGVTCAEAMGVNETVVEETKRFREQRWPGIEGWLIVSNDGRGNPIGIAKDGTVRLSDHDVGDVAVVARSFEEFLLKLLTDESLCGD